MPYQTDYIVTYLDNQGNKHTVSAKAEDAISAQCYVRKGIIQPVKVISVIPSQQS